MARPLQLAAFGLVVTIGCTQLEQRNEVTHRRALYNAEFFWRHNQAFRIGAAIHFAHAEQHDVLIREPLARAAESDGAFNAAMVEMARKPPRTEPSQELYAPLTAQLVWRTLRAIDWTHILHEQTYDIMADASIAWSEKKRVLDASVRYYLDKNPDVAFSPAPLDVTMRRAAVLMKPYFTVFRTHYPHSNNFFYSAHWWHPSVYEAMMIGGNGAGQEQAVRRTSELFYHQALYRRPLRMLLSREVMPRYARLSPESANIFDNLHMFHGIVYDILAFEGWSMAEKRAEIYRVIEALLYRPGDEALARKFAVPRPEMSPLEYQDWMLSVEGDMNRMMREMLDEMMPMMMGGQRMDPGQMQRMQAVFRSKLAPGLDEGEHPGSLMDALKQLMPGMQMSPESMSPGGSPEKMSQTMLAGWRAKQGATPDAEPWPMSEEPSR